MCIMFCCGEVSKEIDWTETFDLKRGGSDKQSLMHEVYVFSWEEDRERKICITLIDYVKRMTIEAESYKK